MHMSIDVITQDIMLRILILIIIHCLMWTIMFHIVPIQYCRQEFMVVITTKDDIENIIETTIIDTIESIGKDIINIVIRRIKNEQQCCKMVG